MVTSGAHPKYISESGVYTVLVRQIFRYTLGRAEALDDFALLDALEARFVAGEHRFLDLVSSLIASPAFRRVGALDQEGE